MLGAALFASLTFGCSDRTNSTAATSAANGAPTPGAPAQVASTPVPADPRVRANVVVLDPGHGGDEVGAANGDLAEKDSNLDMAQRVQRVLSAAGVEAVLTRHDGGRAGGVTATGFAGQRADLAERVHIANESRAALFVSLHSNGAADTAQRGVEVYYDSRRPFGATSEQAAHTVLQSVLAGAAADGYALTDRGIIDAKCWRSFQGRCVGLYVLSPEGTTTLSGQPVTKPATAMPGMLVELLFLSNPDDAALLRSDAARESIARGVARGILAVLGARAQAP